MKKKIVIFIIIILIIIGAIFVFQKYNNSKLEYTIEQVSEYNYFKYYENSKYGVIDRDGNTIISAEYKNVIIPNPQKDIFVCYDEDENTTVFNSQGEELFSQYDKVEPIKLKNIASILCYEKNVLKYEKDGLYGIIDFEGNEITKNVYDSIENLQSTEGKLLVSKDEKYGVININGRVLVDTKYDTVKTDDFYDEESKYLYSGFIVSNTTSDGVKNGYIDYKGSKILDAEYSDITRVTALDEIYLIVSDNGQYGFYKNSKQIISHEYQSIIYDDSGLLLLQKNKNYGMANLEGDIKIDVNYSEIETRGIYIYAANSNENVVYDSDGNTIDINFNKTVYETDNEDYNITTLLNNDVTYYGIQSKDGTTLVGESYKYIEYVFNDYFIAKDDDGNLGLINANGKVLIDFEYSSMQKVKGKNMLQILEDGETSIYSSNLDIICSLEDATINNEDDYIKIYNDDETLYFDVDGNEISEGSELITSTSNNSLPSTIGDYVKTQYSLDNAYYVEKKLSN